MKRVIAMILAGGQGDRLSVLSEERAKPAVIFGGRYRIIDFALSNCVNSGITRVGVLTQYRPRSLNDHIGIGRPWDLDRAGGGVALLQPYLGRRASDWYSGTADAVYQNLYSVEREQPRWVIVLAGDHIYKMDYDDLMQFHIEKAADVTIPVYTVPWEDAGRFGTLFLDDDGRVTAFDEKPTRPRSNLISMGIYLFNKETARESLVQDAQRPDSKHDLGGDVIPQLVREGASVYGYRFNDYWRDVGTIQAYFDANMDLLEGIPQLNLYDAEMQVHTRIIDEPPAKIGKTAVISRSLISHGSIINGHVEHSVLSPGVYVEEGAVVRDAIIFDGTHVEAGAIVDRSIIDKECRVGGGAHVGYGDDWAVNRDRPDVVNCGISIIGKRSQVAPGVRIGRNCVIGPGVLATGVDGDEIPSGSTLRGEQRAPAFSV